MIFLVLYLVHILALAYTSWPEGFTGKGYNGLDDLRIKLPLLLLPIIIGTSQRLTRHQIKTVMLWFTAAVVSSTLISTGILMGIGNYEIHDIREISIFLSHIRFSLLINISIFALAYYLFTEYRKIRQIERLIYGLIIIWLIVFLILLQALTGVTVLVICSSIFVAFQAYKIRKPALRYATILIFIGIPILVASYVAAKVNDFREFDQINYNELPASTINGNPYVHNSKNIQVENGHWVGLYICQDEMRREWNKRSELNYDKKDKQEHFLRFTLMRYLTSLNLTKDSAGIAALGSLDIKAIESGKANHLFNNKFSLYPRIYETIWEIDLYLRGGNPSGHSVSQRMEYLRAAYGIIEKNPMLGVGTGDLQHAFKQQYIEMDTQLTQHKRLRAHNQLVTFIIAFGFIGFLLILWALFYPVHLEKKFRNFLFMMVLIIGLISMFNEDTLETQPGVTFFAFFYCLFLFGQKE